MFLLQFSTPVSNHELILLLKKYDFAGRPAGRERTMSKSAPSASSSSQSRCPAVAVITCAVLEDEIAHFAAKLDQIVQVEILEQGLHNEPDELRKQVQAAIDRIEETTDAEAIVLGYGLCSRGIEGLTTRRCNMIVARAHDCITLLLGCRQRYADYVERHPGTYWYSPGWNRHHIPPGKDRYEQLLQEYCDKYGPDNGEYLMEMEQHWFKTYDRATYVDLGISDTREDVEYTKQCAEWLGWSFDRQQGDPALLESLLSGEWDEERFLVVRPGQTVRLTADERVIEAVAPNDSDAFAPRDTDAKETQDV